VPIPTDKELDCTIAKMLKFGVTVAALVVLAGGVMLLRHPMLAIPDYSHFHAVDASLRSIGGIAASAFHRNPRGLVQLGLILLIATPIARVAFCIAGFMRQKDRLYTGISALVLVILLYSLTKGAH
jgi:uncharacterized membrane protein